MKNKIKPDFNLEMNIKDKGYKLVAGVDEAGRGAWAGPIVAAAVIFNDYPQIDKLNDSKKLSAKLREELIIIIIKSCYSHAIAEFSNTQIDNRGLGLINKLVLVNALQGLEPKADYALVDGFKLNDLSIPAEQVIKGDQKSCTIAAASIIAKVTRDKILDDIHQEYPQYGFDKHKGYGTKQHQLAIAEFGVCPYHRLSYRPLAQYK